MGVVDERARARLGARQVLEPVRRAVGRVELDVEPVVAVVLPAVGGALSGQPRAYRYLSETVDSYRTPAELRAMAGAAGWSQIGYHGLAMGTVGIVVGRRDA